ncbi:MAG TPA: DUF2844 domain-containing protein [Candidatus Sulfotelmatobacter sp.]|nr:DUF2844 domain-containing protein [Candidatus Sulfotelmatobacter sp.]
MILTTSALFWIVPAFATLGEDVSTVRADQVRIQATETITRKSAYTVHELQSASGVAVREYVSSAGKVFAVAWHGPTMPDLKQLLGSHFQEYQQALQAQGQRARRGPIFVELPNLVIHLGGHMRDFVGHAYLPDQMPSGVRAEEIR